MKFRQLVVNIVIKELQMVFLTSTVINSNGNMKELELKIKCEKLMFRLVLWSTQRLSTFMSTQRISRHVDITFNISTKEQWKIKCQ